ncbi:MAG: EAL domain-containing protein [Alphaproteobacteria bacterium]|nr:EAL domain-containing protein [Alphaproteobacteria bacterium]
MSLLLKYISHFKIKDLGCENQVTLNRERHEVMTRQAPLMYAAFIINMIALLYPHWDNVPHILSLLIPGIFVTVFIHHGFMEYNNIKRHKSDEQIAQKLYSSMWESSAFAIALLVWSYLLFSYEIPMLQIQIMIFLYMTLTVFAFFLMYVLPTVVLVSVIILVPSTIYLVMTGDVVFSALSLNTMFIALTVIFLLFNQYEILTNLINQKLKLTRQKQSLVEQATKLEIMNDQNLQLANIDTLTALPNRRSFFAQLEQLTSKNTGRPTQKLVVGLMDLDGFKRINDVFGHPAGDALLVKTSQRLQDILGTDINISRLGGDEFGIIITNSCQIDDIQNIGQSICDAMRQVFHLKEGSVQIAATIGFVEYPQMAPTSQLLFERADYALCYSKQHSKGQAVIFSTEHETIIRNISNIEHQLRETDLEQELSIVFQPIIDVQTNKTSGFEALARWENPTLGQVSPDVFIGAAEQMGIIGKLTIILLRKALKAASQWPDDLYMSFNLSIYDLSSPQTVLGLISIVEKSDFPSHRIVFEITETAVMNDFKQANEALNLLKLQGAQIALDDFGTGYSSLSYVQRMPLDRLKIDRSFITDIASDKHTRNIVQTIIDLCNNLNLDCIIEGVEEPEQLSILKQMGCRYVQGYYFSKPLHHEDALKFLGPKQNINNKSAAAK